jgi:hypothetical protein
VRCDCVSSVSPRSTGESWTFALQRPVLCGSLGTDLAATVLAMPIALFRVVNQERFGGNPQTLGLFMSAIALGGVTTSLTSNASATAADAAAAWFRLCGHAALRRARA